MHRFAARVRKIELATGDKHAPHWHVVDECGHALFIDEVANNPDMRLVQPCDTDPMTYARIQVTIAYADRDERLLNRWFSRAFPPHSPRRPEETDNEYLDRTIPAFKANEEVYAARKQAALVAARTRIAAQRA